MAKGSDDFFEGKREWSKIKDKVLGDYMKVYLAKVNTRGQPILLIDGYAGPGVFEDGTCGSPIIMCERAEEGVKGNYHAIFINKNKEHHKRLCSEIQRRGWSASARPLLGDTRHLLPELSRTLKDETVFLYLDPFGPTGCNFALLQPFLDRNPKFSTEILLTMNMMGIHRLAARHAVEEGRETEEIKKYRQKLTQVFGGTYWQDIMSQSEADPETLEMQLMKAYQEKLTKYLDYTGFCPVRAQIEKPIKYFIVFASHHKDAMLRLNDIMLRAYFRGMHESSDFGKGLFKDFDWREIETRHTGGLEGIIMETVTKRPGEMRKSIWLRIVKQYFMLYLEPEYGAAVRRLVKDKKITFTSKTGNLNDECQLFLANRAPLL